MKCRICLHTEPRDTLISPCDCKGSMEWVHLDCLTRSRSIEGREDKCATCSVEYIDVPMQLDPLFGMTWTQTYIAEAILGLALSLAGASWVDHPGKDGIVFWLIITSIIYIVAFAVFIAVPASIIVSIHRWYTR